MKQALFLVVLSLLFVVKALAVEIPDVLENHVYTETIKTVEMYRNGWRLSNPIIELGSDQQLVFSFDDLTNDKADYRYTIFHCDRNWHVSRLSQLEYLEGNTDFALTDFAFSRNTKFNYINYQLQLPNNDVQFKYSGNYALVVFDSENPETPVLTWRFYVVEQKVTLTARIHQGEMELSGYENQEIDFAIDKGSLQVQNPNTDFKVVVTQNNRADNAITDLKPLFIKGNILDYDYNKENNFKGENEFRFFELRSLKYNGERVESIQFRPPYYHIVLLPDEPRTSMKYNFTREMNGNFSIEAYDTELPNTEADYMFVHFTLKTKMPLMGGVYVFGKLTNWQFNKENQMKYNVENKQYELGLLLKQGYYNFAYAFKDENEKQAKMFSLEGSHFETENEYQLYV